MRIQSFLNGYFHFHKKKSYSYAIFQSFQVYLFWILYRTSVYIAYNIRFLLSHTLFS